MEWIPKTGERYKDDADNMYQIIAVAVHAETEERMVVYQEMFGEFGIYARAVQQFTGENGCRRMFTKADRKTDQKADLKTDQTVDTRSDGTTDQPVQVRKENQSLQPAGSRLRASSRASTRTAPLVRFFLIAGYPPCSAPRRIGSPGGSGRP